MQRLLVTGTVRPVVRKKAALCLLRLFRRNPEVLNKEEWCAARLAPPFARVFTRLPHRADALPTLLDERDHGLLTSVLSFLQGLVAVDSNRSACACGARVSHTSDSDPLRLTSFRGCLPKVVRLLDRLVRTQDVPPDYLYYSLPSPWMQARRCAASGPFHMTDSAFAWQQIKCMRILQQFPLADDPSLAGAVSAVLQRIIAVRASSARLSQLVV